MAKCTTQSTAAETMPESDGMSFEEPKTPAEVPYVVEEVPPVIAADKRTAEKLPSLDEESKEEPPAIEESKEEQPDPKIEMQKSIYDVAPVTFNIERVPSEYREVVSMFLEQEKFRVMQEASRIGIEED